MKILFLYPQDICYGVVDTFAKHLTKALRDEGVKVEVFDIKTTDPSKIVSVLKNEYAGILDFYSGLAGITTADGAYVWDFLDAPFFQLCLDYPLFITDQLDIPLKKHFILCGNDRFIPVIKTAMPHVADAFFFPMTGVESKTLKSWNERRHDCIFIGTYNDYREHTAFPPDMDGDIRLLAETLFKVMAEDSDLDQTEAMKKTLECLNISLSEEEMYEWFKVIGGVARGAFALHRERIVKNLLGAGVKLEVFGDSWKRSPFAENPNIIISPELKEDDYEKVLSDTKVSLNVMYANRSGFTERYGYSMLNGAVCLSDRSDYICKNFTDGEDIVFYDMKDSKSVGENAAWLLKHPNESQAIAKRAYDNALAHHTWEKRAFRLLEIMVGTLVYKGSEPLAARLPEFFSDNKRREKFVTKSSKMKYLDIAALITEEEWRGGIRPLFINRFNEYSEFLDYWNRLRFRILRAQFEADDPGEPGFDEFIKMENLSCVTVKYALLTASFKERQKSLIREASESYRKSGKELECQYLLKVLEELPGE